MATIRKRGTKWQVQIRRAGFPAVTRTFHRKIDAHAWARQTEVEADRNGLPADPKQLRRITLDDLIQRYRDAVSAKKRGHEIEAVRLNAMLRHPMTKATLAELTPALFSAYRDQRLETAKPETVRRELWLLQHVIEVARRDWGITLSQNPVAEIRKPEPSMPRSRRLEAQEFASLMAGCRKCRNKRIAPLIELAIETGMRRGELLAIRWGHVDFERRTLHIPNTKNGHARTIPLSTSAFAILTRLRTGSQDRPFPISGNAIRLAWGRLTKRAGIPNLHFHDLRHEAISRLFERGLTVPEVALISGHRDVRQLFRYTHLRPEDLVTKLG